MGKRLSTLAYDTILYYVTTLTLSVKKTSVKWSFLKLYWHVAFNAAPALNGSIANRNFKISLSFLYV